ncbi:MAG TPA: hypothetical protein ENH42_00060 [Desulfobacteraceae bacterium]|nr:carbamoyl phosphate synthase-like protein [bacterium BMS3Abin13]HDZ75792.1 hypothetical protein [Desulfobacteraceae bacterium]
MVDPIGKNRTILLLGNYRPALTLARTLSANGYKIIVGTQGCDHCCEHSHFVSQMWDHSDCTEHASLFLKELDHFSKVQPALAAIFPVSETYVRFFAENSRHLPGLPPVIMMDKLLVKKCLDKLFMMQLAKERCIPMAEFTVARTADELDMALDQLGLPVVIRPLGSVSRLNGEKAIIVRNKTELDFLDIDWQQNREGLLLQKEFSGIRHNIYFAAYEGRIVRYLHAVITRTDRTDGTGLAVDGITVEPDVELRRQTNSLVKALNYSGIGCAQYLVNESTRETSFLEINPRIAGNHAVPEHAGLELGKFLLDLVLTGKPDLTPYTGPAGIRYSWMSGYLVTIKTSLGNGEISIGEALRRWRSAITSALGADVHMMFSWSDPLPGLNALWVAIPPLWRRWRGTKNRHPSSGV